MVLLLLLLLLLDICGALSLSSPTVFCLATAFICARADYIHSMQVFDTAKHAPPIRPPIEAQSNVIPELTFAYAALFVGRRLPLGLGCGRG